MESVKVYVVRDQQAIEFLINDDVERFSEYVEQEEAPCLEEPEMFETEAEALAFCSGLGYGTEERGMLKVYPLRSSEECDLPFIEIIEKALY